MTLNWKALQVSVFTQIWMKIAQTYDFQCISEYISCIYFIYISVLSAGDDLLEKLKFYVSKLINLKILASRDMHWQLEVQQYYEVIIHCWVQYWILLDEYEGMKPILDTALAESDTGFAVVYKSNRISAVLNNV
jgi:hypothetical protein